jgi:hypothetical protein
VAAAARAQGRLIDHLRNTQSVGLEDLQALVLDEADRLLAMGFSEEVRLNRLGVPDTRPRSGEALRETATAMACM